MGKNKRKRKRCGNQATITGDQKSSKQIQGYNKATDNQPRITTNKDKSLQSLLKKYRGVAANTPPPAVWKGDGSSSCNFLTPQDDSFDDCLSTSYN